MTAGNNSLSILSSPVGKLKSLEKKRNNAVEGALTLVRELSQPESDKDLESVLNDANTTLTILIKMLSDNDIPKSDILKKVEDLESLLSKAIQALNCRSTPTYLKT